MLSLLGNLVGPVTGLLDKFIEDKDQKNKLAHEIATMAEKQSRSIMAQIEVLKADAKGNWFRHLEAIIGWIVDYPWE